MHMHMHMHTRKRMHMHMHLRLHLPLKPWQAGGNGGGVERQGGERLWPELALACKRVRPVHPQAQVPAQPPATVASL